MTLASAEEFAQYTSKMDQRKELNSLKCHKDIKYHIKTAINDTAKKMFILFQTAFSNVALDSWELRTQLISACSSTWRVVNVMREF